MHYLTFVQIKLHLPSLCPSFQPIYILLYPLMVLIAIRKSTNLCVLNGLLVILKLTTLVEFYHRVALSGVKKW